MMTTLTSHFFQLLEQFQEQRKDLSRLWWEVTKSCCWCCCVEDIRDPDQHHSRPRLNLWRNHRLLKFWFRQQILNRHHLLDLAAFWSLCAFGCSVFLEELLSVMMMSAVGDSEKANIFDDSHSHTSSCRRSSESVEKGLPTEIGQVSLGDRSQFGFLQRDGDGD